MKRCGRCKVEKANNQFCKSKKKGLQSYCKACMRTARKEWVAANREQVREYDRAYKAKNPEKNRAYSQQWRIDNVEKSKDYQYKKLYGITYQDYLSLAKAQNNCCAICRQESKLVVDHCHSSLKVRGLLCSKCNTALGQFNDNQELIERALVYLGGK